MILPKIWKNNTNMPKYARLRSICVEYSRIKHIYSKQVIRVSNVSAHRSPQPRTLSPRGCTSTGFCASIMVIPQLSMLGSEAVFHVPALLECLVFSNLWNIMQHHLIIYLQYIYIHIYIYHTYIYIYIYHTYIYIYISYIYIYHTYIYIIHIYIYIIIL